jgi:hypothetical protein
MTLANEQEVAQSYCKTPPFYRISCKSIFFGAVFVAHQCSLIFKDHFNIQLITIRTDEKPAEAKNLSPLSLPNHLNYCRLQIGFISSILALVFHRILDFTTGLHFHAALFLFTYFYAMVSVYFTTENML